MKKPKKTKFIRCIDDLLESIEFNNIRRENYIFRGQVNHDWEITSTIMRDINGTPLKYINSHRNELASFKPLIEGSKPTTCRTFHPLEYLMNLQHHNGATRLLDFTRDALIALFFACFDKNNYSIDKHGKLILILIEENEFKNIDLFYNKENESFKRFDIDLIQKSLNDDLMQLSEIKIIEPLIKNARMRSQNGIFILSPLWKSKVKSDNCMSFNEILKEIKKPYFHFLIHKNYKNEILKELKEYYGISEESIFINTKTIKEVDNYSSNLIKSNIDYIENLLNNRN